MRNRRKHKSREQHLQEQQAASRKSAAPIATGLAGLLTKAGLSTLPSSRAARAADSGTRGRTRGMSTTSTSTTSTSTDASAASGAAAPERPAQEGARKRPLRALHTTGELAALNDAYRGVQPIRRGKQARGSRATPHAVERATPDPADEAARERLAALVGGGVRFEVVWDDGLVQALRAGASSTQLVRAGSAAFAPEARLDLHGLRRAQAQRALAEFVRSAHRKGARRLLVIVGKGEHSDDGHGVLGAAAVETLTAGIAAPLVSALCSAHPQFGGRGALAVVLR